MVKHGKDCSCEKCKKQIDSLVENLSDYNVKIGKMQKRGWLGKYTCYILIATHKKTDDIISYMVKKIFV